MEFFFCLFVRICSEHVVSDMFSQRQSYFQPRCPALISAKAFNELRVWWMVWLCVKWTRNRNRKHPNDCMDAQRRSGRGRLSWAGESWESKRSQEIVSGFSLSAYSSCICSAAPNSVTLKLHSWPKAKFANHLVSNKQNQSLSAVSKTIFKTW